MHVLGHVKRLVQVMPLFLRKSHAYIPMWGLDEKLFLAIWKQLGALLKTETLKHLPESQKLFLGEGEQQVVVVKANRAAARAIVDEGSAFLA